ncbi:MAG: hypothetical protein ACI9VX_001633, partial [Dinoroseobacter sp.]
LGNRHRCHAPSLLKHEPNYSYTEDRTLSQIVERFLNSHAGDLLACTTKADRFTPLSRQYEFERCYAFPEIQDQRVARAINVGCRLDFNQSPPCCLGNVFYPFVFCIVDPISELHSVRTMVNDINQFAILFYSVTSGTAI